MRWLLDTGVLLRMIHSTDPQGRDVEPAITRLLRRGDRLACGVQNVAEFWNVSTRPESSRGGFGLSLTETRRRLDVIQRLVGVVFERDAAFAIWQDLLVTHAVSGKQVHDAKLVALMKADAITDVLTLNPKDFRRYEPTIRVHTPADIVAAAEGSGSGHRRVVPIVTFLCTRSRDPRRGSAARPRPAGRRRRPSPSTRPSSSSRRAA